MHITTIAESSSMATLKVEGAITANSVVLLENVCQIHFNNGKRVHLDATDVTFVDRASAEMLNALSDDGLEIINASSLVRAFLRAHEVRE